MCTSYLLSLQNASILNVNLNVYHSSIYLVLQVYGVAIPGYDGRCGMAAIFPVSTAAASSSSSQAAGADAAAAPAGTLLPTSRRFDVAAFGQHMWGSVAPFAMPIFLRLLSAPPPTTATHKHQKTEMTAAGCDPSRVPTIDALFVWLRGSVGEGGGGAVSELGTSATRPLSGGLAYGPGHTIMYAYAYTLLTPQLWRSIVDGDVRL